MAIERRTVSSRILLAGSAGAGLGVMQLLYMLLKQNPQAVVDLLAQWGPIFLFAVIVVYLGDRRFGELISVNRDNVIAQQRMADALQVVAQRDDERAREQELMISELTRNSQMTISHLVEMKQQLQDWKNSRSETGRG